MRTVLDSSAEYNENTLFSWRRGIGTKKVQRLSSAPESIF